ncbi:hypothetical protein [Cellulophaga baltica]|uniref:hypothetical protein n=1 Tax=Cellulophaga baltica TaxID=76594 RepID=UPI0024951CBE|nr:hypothetical protein [Cellulophaga baltica]
MSNLEHIKKRQKLKKSLRKGNIATSTIDAAAANVVKNKVSNGLKKSLKKQEFKLKQPNDWVLGKDGKYIWDENVTYATDPDLKGRKYVGINFSNVKNHFINDNSWLSRKFGSKRDGLRKFVDVDSYYNAKVPLIIEDVFSRYLWKYNLKRKGSNRLANGHFDENNVNNDLHILFPNENVKVLGSISLDGQDFNYNATLNTSAINTAGLKLIDYFDEHEKANSTLARVHSGKIKGQYFAITNNQVFTDIPVISVNFENIVEYKRVKKWFLSHGEKIINEIEEKPWKNK